MSRFAILLAAALVTVPTATLAQGDLRVTAKVNRALVSYADVNITNAKGRRILKRRLSRAIEGVCGSYAGVREESEERHMAACWASAWQSADRQLAARSSTQQLAILVVR